MAKIKQGVVQRIVKPKVNNKGIHAKTKMSQNKTSKNYCKKYRGQGR